MRYLVAVLFLSGCFNFDALSNGDAAEPAALDGSVDGAHAPSRYAASRPEADGGVGDGAVAADGATAPADMPPFYPESCLEVKLANTSATDGTFTLYVAKNPAKSWTAFCKDMATAPKEYLTLVNTGTNQNFSQYTAGGYSPGTSVRTNYTRIRLDPTLLKVDVSDETYSTSTGTITSSTPPVTSMPYGVAMDCTNASLTGVANVDLRGTPFAAATGAFVAGGFYPVGAATYAGSDQIVTLTGGGGCGWVAAGVYASGSPVNVAGGFQMQLVYP